MALKDILKKMIADTAKAQAAVKPAPSPTQQIMSNIKQTISAPPQPSVVGRVVDQIRQVQPVQTPVKPVQYPNTQIKAPAVFNAPQVKPTQSFVGNTVDMIRKVQQQPTPIKYPNTQISTAPNLSAEDQFQQFNNTYGNQPFSFDKLRAGFDVIFKSGSETGQEVQRRAEATAQQSDKANGGANLKSIIARGLGGVVGSPLVNIGQGGQELLRAPQQPENIGSGSAKVFFGGMGFTPLGAAFNAGFAQPQVSKPWEEHIQPLLESAKKALPDFIQNNPNLKTAADSFIDLAPFLVFHAAVKGAKGVFKETVPMDIKNPGDNFFTRYDVPTDRQWWANLKQSVGETLTKLKSDTGGHLGPIGKEENKRPGIDYAAPLPEKVDPLIQEAKKYKSAEEFVKAQTNAYHGTPGKEFSEFKLDAVKNTENETNGLGVWVTPQESAAKVFSNKLESGFMGFGGKKIDVGGTVMPVSTQLKNPKIFTSTKGMESILDDIKKLEGERPSIGQTSPYVESDPEVRQKTIDKRAEILNKIKDLKKQYRRDAFEHFMDDRDQFAEYVSRGAKWEERYAANNVSGTNKKYIEYLKEQGYDGIIIKGTEYDAKEAGLKTIDQIVAFDPKQVLTKSQLTDIWNQANQKLPDTTLKTDGLAFLGGNKKLTPQELYERSEDPKWKIFRSRVYERLENEIPAEMRESVGYSKENLQDNAKKAVTYIKKDKETAYRVAMGMREPPVGQTSTTVNVVMAEKALVEGNFELYSKLTKNRSLAQTRRGQEIVAEKGSVSDNSTSRYVKELINTRLNKVGDKYLFGLEKIKGESNKTKAIRIIDKEVARAKDSISKTKELDMSEAQSIINKLMCK